MTPQTLMGHTVSVSSTCAITKIYGQVHLHANDLVYNQGNQESECPTGSTACAAPYAVERQTELPLLWVPNNDAIPHKTPQYYLAGDAQATGIPGGSHSASIVYVGSPVLSQAGTWQGLIAAVFLASRIKRVPGMGWVRILCSRLVMAGSTAVAPGSTSTALLPRPTAWARKKKALTTSLTTVQTQPNISNIMGAAVYTKSNNTISGYINGVNLFNHSPASDTNTGLGCPCTFKPGRAIYFGGGGDLSQPDAFIAREMMILNLAMTMYAISSNFLKCPSPLSISDVSASLASITSAGNVLTWGGKRRLQRIRNAKPSHNGCVVVQNHPISQSARNNPRLLRIASLGHRCAHANCPP